MISKELLKEVLEINDIAHIQKEGKNDIFISRFKNPAFIINIYELAHKCKVWAFSHNYFVKSGIIPFGNSQAIVYLGLQGEVYRVKIDTELEAIFKACQWILDNKN